jgi:hypothetical protein
MKDYNKPLYKVTSQNFNTPKTKKQQIYTTANQLNK